MKKTLKLDTYLTEDGTLKTGKAVLRDYYKKLSKGETKRDKEAKIKLNLVLYPDFFYKNSSQSPVGSVVKDLDRTARLQNTTPEAIGILHSSQGSIKTRDFQERVYEIGRL